MVGVDARLGQAHPGPGRMSGSSTRTEGLGAGAVSPPARSLAVSPFPRRRAGKGVLLVRESFTRCFLFSVALLASAAHPTGKPIVCACSPHVVCAEQGLTGHVPADMWRERGCRPGRHTQG